MSEVVTIYDAKTNLPKYIRQAKQGHPVYIGSYGQREVILMAAQPQKETIKFGTSVGKFKYARNTLEGIDRTSRKCFTARMRNSLEGPSRHKRLNLALEYPPVMIHSGKRLNN